MAHKTKHVVSPHGDEIVVLEIPVAQLHRDPHQPRTVFKPERITELAKSIEEEGMQQLPVVNYAFTEAGLHHYFIKAGERRWRAHQKLERESMLCIVVPTHYTAVYDVKRDLAQAAENSCREPHTHGEIIALVERVVAAEIEENGGRSHGILNIAVGKVANAFGKPFSWAESYHRLTRLQPQLRELLDSEDDDERITLNLAVSLSSAPPETQDKIWQEAKILREKCGYFGMQRFIATEARRIREGRGEKVRGRRPSDETRKFTRMINGFERMGNNFVGERHTTEHLEYVRGIVRNLQTREVDAMLSDVQATLLVFMQIRDELKRRSDLIHNRRAVGQ